MAFFIAFYKLIINLISEHLKYCWEAGKYVRIWYLYLTPTKDCRRIEIVLNGKMVTDTPVNIKEQ